MAKIDLPEERLTENVRGSNYFAQYLFNIDSDCLKFLFIALTIICGMLVMTMPI